ncbi:hypothetical protein SprV_0401554200 [Sparganum proliferum]
MARYMLEIAELSKTRFSEQDQLEEVDAGHTFLWSGRPRAERRNAGVAFVILNDIVERLPYLPQGINDRLISLRLPLQGGEFATITSVFVPSMTGPDATTDKFYEDLHAFLATVSKAVSTTLMTTAYAVNLLILASTYFGIPTREKATSMHPLWQHWHLLDYVLVRRRDQRDVMVTKVVLGATGGPTIASSSRTCGFAYSLAGDLKLENLPVAAAAAAAARKVFARILLNRLNNHLEQGLLPEIQCGFRHHRGTPNTILAARQLQDKCREMRTHPRHAKEHGSFAATAAACENFALIIKAEDTVVMHQHLHNPAYVAPQITVNDVQLQVVDNFTYLSSTLSRSTIIDDELTCRIPKASQAFGRLQNTVWYRHSLRLSTKLKM